MAEMNQENPRPTSTGLAADTSLFPVWDPAVPFPSPQDMCELDAVTHISVERAQKGGYHYLHEATIARHRDLFYMGWANHRTRETGDHDELIRGCTSPDALHWSKPEIWAQAPLIGGTSHNHPLLFSHEDTLYGFFVCWREGHFPTTEVFTLDDATGKWVHHKESAIPLFVPFCTPQRMDNGNWIIGGERHWDDAAVAISDGDNLLKWRMVTVPRPESLRLLFPESALVYRGNNRLLLLCRPLHHNAPGHVDQWTAPAAESLDGGETWTTLRLSNFPLAESQPFAGRLSTGQNYLLTNNLEDERCLLSIALTGPEGGLFRRVLAVRHQQWPRVRLFENSLGRPTELAYPGAIEYDGKLYIAYSQGKEDCSLSIVPIEVLKV